MKLLIAAMHTQYKSEIKNPKPEIPILQYGRNPKPENPLSLHC